MKISRLINPAHRISWREKKARRKKIPYVFRCEHLKIGRIRILAYEFPIQTHKMRPNRAKIPKKRREKKTEMRMMEPCVCENLLLSFLQVFGNSVTTAKVLLSSNAICVTALHTNGFCYRILHKLSHKFQASFLDIWALIFILFVIFFAKVFVTHVYFAILTFDLSSK